MSDETSLAKLQQNIVDLQSKIQAVKIIDVETYIAAGQLAHRIAERRKEVDEAFAPIIAQTRKAWQTAIDQKKRYLVPLELGQGEIDRKILQWDSAQRELRRRQEEELAAQKKREQEEQAIAEAAELARQGDHDLAEEVLQQAVEAPAPVVVVPNMTAPKLEGFSKRTVWKWKVENAALVPREYLCIDEVKIGGVVRALKDATKIPGIKVYPEEIAAHRGIR